MKSIPIISRRIILIAAMVVCFITNFIIVGKGQYALLRKHITGYTFGKNKLWNGSRKSISIRIRPVKFNDRRFNKVDIKEYENNFD